jgi:outer membrane autotransporter protein
LGGATIYPGDAIGTLTVQNNITLSGTLVMELNRTNSPVCDQLVSIGGTITAGGTLTVSNLGPLLQAGDVFPIFDVPVNGFTTVRLPSLPVNCVWKNSLAIDGTIRVMTAVSTNATNITLQTASNVLTLSWPLDHTGWRLQAQPTVSIWDWAQTGWMCQTRLMLIKWLFPLIQPMAAFSSDRFIRESCIGV